MIIERRSFIKKTLAAAAAAHVPLMSKGGTMAIAEQKGPGLNLPDLSIEIKRSKSEFTVYVPKSADGSTFDNENEHFLVFPGPDGSLMAVWSQATVEGHGDSRIMFSKSNDKGRTWAEPKFLVGVKPGDGQPISVGTGEWVRPNYEDVPNIKSMASWGYPLISRSGRIYVVYNQYKGIIDTHVQFTGTMDAIYSDDYGKTWSTPQTIPMKRSIWDNPDPSIPSNWIVWQKPHLDLSGRWFVGFTRWLSPSARPSREGVTKPRLWRPGVVEFMRYENIDSNPEPKDIKISWFASDHKALKVYHPDLPSASFAEEPSITRLPDNRFFCTMRTLTNCIWYSISEDDGETWSSTKPLLYHDHGFPIISPCFCTPIYKLHDGRYMIIHHPAYKTPDLLKKYKVADKQGENRWPAFIALGEYRPDAEQPIWFSKSKLFMSNDGVPLGPRAMLAIGGYGSLTSVDGEDIYWHPDRKFFLLGKKISEELLSGLEVPKYI